MWDNLKLYAYDQHTNTRLIYRVYSAPTLVACQRYIDRNLVYRIYYPAFYARRSVRAAYRECCRANKRYKLPPWPKKPYKSRASRWKGKGLGGAALPSTGGKIGGRGRRGKRGSSGGAGVGGIVSI